MANNFIGYVHRRTENFLPGGGGRKPFAQKILASDPYFLQKSSIASKSRHYLFCFSKIKKILGTGNLTGSFTGAFFANTVFLIFAKFKKNL